MIIRHTIAIVLYVAIGIPCAAVSVIAEPFRKLSAWSLGKAKAHLDDLKALRNS